MNWVRSSTDGNGVRTIYPPKPKRYEDFLKCSFCGGITQFLHFFPEVLRYLKNDAEVASFCSGICAGMFISKIKHAQKGPDELDKSKSK